ncbi:Os02g0699836 [Oryza sativa Japonica Group]|uniref:Os02g0699836 protein n=1 Tax=Oryza sativa subsp. japonica TaxID=39947 RepID=A0A0P0VNL5_ORYSJ|nr:hypothetical protein EE612_013111 [Oryza sativa]BAS80455.1 Os02g0699836 [Oryza sativa Japonica Group]
MLHCLLPSEEWRVEDDPTPDPGSRYSSSSFLFCGYTSFPLIALSLASDLLSPLRTDATSFIVDCSPFRLKHIIERCATSYSCSSLASAKMIGFTA